jgi:competence protein ComEA
MRPFVALMFVLYVSNASGQKGQQRPNSDGKDAATFRAICGSCHSPSLVEGLRTEPEWKDEVDQMIKIGARGTQEQLQAVMRFLTRTLTKVNVNEAEARQIAPILDVPDSVAEAIVKRRTANGPFKTIEDLERVPGLDAVKLEAYRDRLLF